VRRLQGMDQDCIVYSEKEKYTPGLVTGFSCLLLLFSLPSLFSVHYSRAQCTHDVPLLYHIDVENARGNLGGGEAI